MDRFDDDMLFDDVYPTQFDKVINIQEDVDNERLFPIPHVVGAGVEVENVNMPPNGPRDVLPQVSPKRPTRRSKKKPVVPDKEKEKPDELPGGRDRPWLLTRIEHIFEEQVDALFSNETHLSVTLKSRKQPPATESPSHTSERPLAASSRTFQFPGKSEQEAWRYTVVIRILELVHEALVHEVVITKRDIYYRDPNLFSKQSVVDRFVDDLACTFDVPRSLLNVTATAKGLVAGAFTITRPDGTSMNGLGERDGTLISRLHGDETVDMAQVRWILIVEKEATINCLITNAHFYDNYLTQGIIITAKGYPDLSTRSLLSLLTTQTPSPPLSILVDYDPDGLSILSTYKYGSTSTSHENLTLPSIRWLGVNSSYIGKQDSLHQSQGLLRLSGRDRRLAARMLEKQLFGEDGPEQEWRVEVQRMLMLNVKAEIQVLEAGPGGLVGWMKGSGLFD